MSRKARTESGQNLSEFGQNLGIGTVELKGRIEFEVGIGLEVIRLVPYRGIQIRDAYW